MKSLLPLLVALYLLPAGFAGSQDPDPDDYLLYFTNPTGGSGAQVVV